MAPLSSSWPELGVMADLVVAPTPVLVARALSECGRRRSPQLGWRNAAIFCSASISKSPSSPTAHVITALRLCLVEQAEIDAAVCRTRPGPGSCPATARRNWRSRRRTQYFTAACGLGDGETQIPGPAGLSGPSAEGVTLAAKFCRACCKVGPMAPRRPAATHLHDGR